MGGRQFARRPRPQSGLEPIAGSGRGREGRRGRVGVPVDAEGLADRQAAQVPYPYVQGEGHVRRRYCRLGRNLLHDEVGLRPPQHLQCDRHCASEQTAIGHRGQ